MNRLKYIPHTSKCWSLKPLPSMFTFLIIHGKYYRILSGITNFIHPALKKRNIAVKNWAGGLCSGIFLAKRAVVFPGWTVPAYCLKLSTASCATASARHHLPQASSTGWKWFSTITAQEIHAQRYQVQGNRVQASKSYLWEKGRMVKVEGKERNLETAQYARNCVAALALLFLDALKSKKQRKNSPKADFFQILIFFFFKERLTTCFFLFLMN